jgi:preprotein translocase subunit SecA
MQSIGLEKGEAIEHRMVNNAIEKAQRKVEGHNFDVRKNLLEYDDVANDQRQVIYQRRRELMEASDIAETIVSIREEVIRELVNDYIPRESIEEQWDVAGLEQALLTEFGSTQPVARWLEEDTRLTEETLTERIHAQIVAEVEAKEALWLEQNVDMRLAEKQIMLQILDQRWKEHLARMDQLRQGIHLRAYAQKQPKQEYKRESFELFQELLSNIRRDVVRFLSRVQIESPEAVEEAERRRREEAEQRMRFSHPDAAATGLTQSEPLPQRDEAAATSGSGRGAAQASDASRPETFVRSDRKVGRNEPCPCGSGKKYKHCHGELP